MYYYKKKFDFLKIPWYINRGHRMKTVFALYKKVCGGGNAESTGIKTGFWGPVLINQNLQILIRR